MTKKEAQAITDCLIGESKYGIEGLAHLDEFVPTNSPHYQNAQRISKWFKENGDKKGKSTPKWIRRAIGAIQMDAFDIK